MAAGMSLPKDKFTEFKKGLGKAIEKQLGEITREEPTLQIDAWLGLNEIDLGLAEALEFLAPFGAGNPELVLATRNVAAKSFQEIGKTREHRRIIVADESGNERDLLWWNGAGEQFPDTETKFDIAYSLRASTYRGQRQVTLQFEEFRVVEEKPVEVRKSGIEISDWRLESRKFDSLQENILVWAEGSDKSKGKSRFELKQSDEFAIYTTPPSPVDLRKALEIVKPKTIYVFGIPPAEERAEDFLNRLAGLCKYSLNQRGGNVTLQELTAAMASRDSAVQVGLEWLAAGGQLTVGFEEEQITLSAKKQDKNPYLQAELFIALRGILGETSAFRKYFAAADLKELIRS
jgi:single-stranded-DNA-specific exonuclease